MRETIGFKLFSNVKEYFMIDIYITNNRSHQDLKLKVNLRDILKKSCNASKNWV